MDPLPQTTSTERPPFTSLRLFRDIYVDTYLTSSSPSILPLSPLYPLSKKDSFLSVLTLIYYLFSLLIYILYPLSPVDYFTRRIFDRGHTGSTTRSNETLPKIVPRTKVHVYAKRYLRTLSLLKR